MFSLFLFYCQNNYLADQISKTTTLVIIEAWTWRLQRVGRETRFAAGVLALMIEIRSGPPGSIKFSNLNLKLLPAPDSVKPPRQGWRLSFALKPQSHLAHLLHQLLLRCLISGPSSRTFDGVDGNGGTLSEEARLTLQQLAASPATSAKACLTW